MSLVWSSEVVGIAFPGLVRIATRLLQAFDLLKVRFQKFEWHDVNALQVTASNKLFHLMDQIRSLGLAELKS